MTVATATENSTYEPCEEPPIKKQKVEGGAALTTASAGITDLSTEDVKVTKGRSKKRKRSKSKKTEFKTPCNEMPQFLNKDYVGVLWNYMHKIKGIASPKLVFKTTEDLQYKLPHCRFYVSTCKVESDKGSLSGRGRASTKKKSKQMACLQIIQKQSLVPEKMKVDTMSVTLPQPPKKKAKPIKPIIEYNSYLRGNFKGALEQYLRRNAVGFKVSQESLCRRRNKMEYEFLTTCTGSNGKYKSTGLHQYKKKSVQLAWLNLILVMKLITKEQHLEKHPPAAIEEKEEEKIKDADKSSKSLLSDGVKEQLLGKNEALSDPSGEHTAPIVKQDVAMSEESTVDQNVDEPSKKLEEENMDVDEPSLKVDKQKEDAQAQPTVTANEKEEKVNENQTADEVSKMEVETEAAT